MSARLICRSRKMARLVKRVFLLERVLDHWNNRDRRNTGPMLEPSIASPSSD